VHGEKDPFFNFELTNTKDQIVCKAKSTVVFVNAKSRKPIRAPFWLQEIFENAFNLTTV
jgi:acyl-CoA thioesterase FadM